MSTTLFDKYGGVPVVTEIVRDFYKRILKRPNLRRYFEGVSMEHLIQHQIAFVSLAMGKTPEHYLGRNMKQAHRGVGITSASFDLVMEILGDSLRAYEITEDDIEIIVGNIKRFKRDIVER